MSMRRLPPVEGRVLQLLCEGRTQREVANKLGVPLWKVANVSRRIKDLTGCRTGVEMGVWAVRNGYAPTQGGR